jgi:CheY-like chemotaxis protein
LIVEDDIAVRQMAVKVLEDLGYRVRQAPDGQSALEIIRGTDRVDLLFTDMIMFNGMSGAELIEAARHARPDIKVLLASGYTAHSSTRTQDDDAVPFLNKPYRREVLATAVRAALSTNQGGRGELPFEAMRAALLPR